MATFGRCCQQRNSKKRSGGECRVAKRWAPSYTLCSVDLGHVLDQVNDAARVAPLVVVPGHELHERGVQHDARLGIEGAGDGARLEVGGHERLVAVAKEPLHVALRASLDLGADLLVGRRLLQLTSEVHDRHVDRGHAEGHARELARHLRHDLRHRLGRPSGGGDDVARCRTATAPVLLRRPVHGWLRRGHGVDSSHQAPLDAERVVDGLHHGGEAVGGARCARDATHVTLVGVLVHAHHYGVAVVLSRGREHDLLRARLEVRLDLLVGQEHAGGLADVLRPVLLEGDLGRVAGVRQGHLVAIDHQGVPVDLDGAVVPAVDRVVLHLVRKILRIVARVHQLELRLWVLHDDAGHLAPDAPETVDADADRLPGHLRG
mmetsp:Transcript_105495/g.278618  ORF Transcript_105495/g.278618 Transcript_105495/m.278618 type:complete len:376 (+) Transcript_105495:49-1176(+)